MEVAIGSLSWSSLGIDPLVAVPGWLGTACILLEYLGEIIGSPRAVRYLWGIGEVIGYGFPVSIGTADLARLANIWLL